MEFKIGDRVRNSDGEEGVITKDDGTATWPLRADMDDGNYFWVARDGSDCGSIPGPVTIVSETDELAKLRAFKAAVIARFPALAEPETDDEAAARFEEEYWSDIYKNPRHVVIAAFEWARANPR